MKRCLFTVACIVWAITAIAQTIFYGGKKYDYKFSFPEFSLMELRGETPETGWSELLEKQKQPLTVYLNRSGFGLLKFGTTQTDFTFSPRQCREEEMGYPTRADMLAQSIVNALTFDPGRKDSVVYIGDNLQIGALGLYLYFDIHSEKKLRILVNSKKYEQTLSKIYQMVKKKTFFRLPPVPAGTTRKTMEGKDGRTWYLLKKNGRYGAQNEAFKNIIPCEYDTIHYNYSSGGWNYKDGGYQGRYESRYFTALKDDGVAAYTIQGTCVVPLDRGYSSVSVPAHSFDRKRVAWTYNVKGRKTSGLLDARGNVVVPPTECPELEGWEKDGIYFFLDGNMLFEKGPLYIECWTKYTRWDDNEKKFESKEFHGAYDTNGNCIIPLNKYDRWIGVVTESQGYGRTLSADNNDRLYFSCPSETRFDYEPFEGLLDIILNH